MWFVVFGIETGFVIEQAIEELEPVMLVWTHGVW